MGSKKHLVKKSRRTTKRRRARGGGIMTSISSFWSWVTGKGDTKSPTMGEIPPSPGFDANSTPSTTLPSEESVLETTNMDAPVSEEATSLFEPTATDIPSLNQEQDLVVDAAAAVAPPQDGAPLDVAADMPAAPVNNDAPIPDIDQPQQPPKDEKPLSVFGGKKRRRKTKRRSHRAKHTRRN